MKGESGCLTFHSGVFEKLLKAPVSSHLKEAIAGRVRLKPEFLQSIAEAMLQWAIGLDATHFCHWFQPLTGRAAEKQDAFLSWDMRGKPIQEFTAFEGILTKEELTARVRILKQQYCKILHIEAKILLEGFHTQILPAALEWQKHVADSIRSIGSRPPQQRALLKKITGQIERSLKKASELEAALHRTLAFELDKQALAFADNTVPKCEALRQEIDALEGALDDRLWPFPKYSEMLSSI